MKNFWIYEGLGFDLEKDDGYSLFLYEPFSLKEEVKALVECLDSNGLFIKTDDIGNIKKLLISAGWEYSYIPLGP